MKEDKLVSIIMPTYNRANVISKSIESVINQTYDNWELVIVDDSTDELTKIIIDEYCDSRIKYYKNKSRCGVCKKRNFGVNVSSGDYITFLDSDCILSEDKIEMQVKDLENGNFGMVFCGTDVVLENGTHLFFPQKDETIIDYKQRLIVQNYIDTSAAMIKRNIFNACGGFDESITLEDWDLYIRIICCSNVPILYEPYYKLLNIRQKDSLSNNLEGVCYGNMRIAHKFCDLFDKNRRRNTVKNYIRCSRIASSQELMSKLNSWGINEYSISDIADIYLELYTHECNQSVMKKYFLCKELGLDIKSGIKSFFGDATDIIIYGLGKNGSVLFNEISDLNINILYGIDQTKKEFNGIPIKTLNDELFEADYLVITTQNNMRSIYKKVEERYYGKIVTIFEVFQYAMDYIMSERGNGCS